MRLCNSTWRTLKALLVTAGLAALLSLGACSSSNGPSQPGQPTPPSASGNWILEHGDLYAGYILGLWASGPNDVWGVTSDGYIYHFDGVAWSLEDPWDRDPRNLWDLWGFADDDVWAVGEGSSIWHYDGERWGFVASEIQGDCLAVWGASANDVWIGCTNGEVWHYDGSDLTLDDDLNFDIRDIVGTGSNDVFAVGASGEIWHYDGSAWTQMSTPTTNNLMGACVDDQNRVYAVGYSGTVIRWNGASWSALSSGTSMDLRGVTSAGGNVYAVGEGGTILLYDGSGWGVMTSGVTSTLWNVLTVSNNFLVASGEQGTLLAGDGATWHPIFEGDLATVYCVDLADDGSAWAGDASGRIWQRGADGWEVAANNSQAVRGIWSAASDDVWAVGHAGSIWHYDGSAWASHGSPTTQPLYAIAGSAVTGEAWAVGNNGTVIRYDPGSGDWSTVSTGTTYTLLGCVVQDDGTVFVTGDAGTLLRWDPTDEAWYPEQMGWEFRVYDLVGLSDGSLAACDGEGHVYWRSPGGGWRTEWVSGNLGLAGIWGSSPTALWVLEEGGRIKFYNGQSWTTVADVSLATLLAIDGNAHGDMVAGGEYERLLHYTP